MNLKQATQKACEQLTLVDALTWICLWESERAVEQARNNPQWETCFRVCISSVMEAWEDRQEPKSPIVMYGKDPYEQ